MIWAIPAGWLVETHVVTSRERRLRALSSSYLLARRTQMESRKQFRGSEPVAGIAGSPGSSLGSALQSRVTALYWESRRRTLTVRV